MRSRKKSIGIISAKVVRLVNLLREECINEKDGSVYYKHIENGIKTKKQPDEYITLSMAASKNVQKVSRRAKHSATAAFSSPFAQSYGYDKSKMEELVDTSIQHGPNDDNSIALEEDNRRALYDFKIQQNIEMY